MQTLSQDALVDEEFGIFVAKLIPTISCGQFRSKDQSRWSLLYIKVIFEKRAIPLAGLAKRISKLVGGQA